MLRKYRCKWYDASKTRLSRDVYAESLTDAANKIREDEKGFGIPNFYCIVEVDTNTTT